MKNLTTTFALSLCTTLAFGATNTAQAGDFYPGDSITLRGDQFGTPRFFSAEDNGDLVFSRTLKGDETVFEIHREGGGSGPLKYGDRIGFQNTNGTYITAMHAGENHNAVARAPHLNDWEYFTIVDMDGNTPHKKINEFTPFALKGAHGLVVSGHQSGVATAGTPHIDAWETIYMELDTPSCDGATDAHGISLECADEMWEAAGCSTQKDHSGWIQWGRDNNLSMHTLRNDFNAWATLPSQGHVNGCQSDAQIDHGFYSGQAIHITSKYFGTYFINTNGDLRVEDAGDAPTAIQLIKVNGDGALKFGDLIALRFEDGSFVTAMNSSENFNAVARAPHLDQWEVFKIVDINGASSGQKITSDSTFALVSTHGKYFSATPQGEVKAQVHHVQGWEHFQMLPLATERRSLINIDVDYGSTSGTYNEGDVVGAYASAGASVEFGTEFEIGEGIVLSSTIGAGAEAEANVCAGLNPSECAGVYADAQFSAGIYAENELDIDSDAGKINVCAGSMAGVEASAEGGAVINGDGATAGAGFEAGATVGSEACAGITGQYGNIGGKAGVTVGPSVSAGMQMSFNFDGCTWSTSVDGDIHILVGIELEGDGGINFCHVGEEVAELATDLWYDVMEGEVVEEWTVGAAEDVAQWTVGAANDMADWTSGAANDAGKWTVGAANDVADWTSGAANDVADWTSGAAYDVADWTSGAAYDVGDWTVGAANDVADWTEGAAEDAWNWTKGASGSVGSFFSSWW